MAYMRVRSLFVLTLLQLCRAEISDSLPESWYSANVINDGFQPKSISEIFSTESPFSSTNPIIVLPKSSSVPDEIVLLSTLSPARKISTTGSSSGDFSRTSVIGLPFSTPLPPTPPSTLSTISPSTFPSTPATFQTTPATIADFSPTLAPQLPQIITQFTEQTQTPSQPGLPTTLSVPQPIFEQQTTLVQPPSPSSSQSAQTQSQQIRLEVVPQDQVIPSQSLPVQLATTQQQTQTSTAGPLSNYFLIYQQAPQSIQGYPALQEVPQFTTGPQSSTTGAPPTVIIQPAPTVSSLPTRVVSLSTTPLPLTMTIQTTRSTRTANVTSVSTTPRLLSPLDGGIPLRIRVVAPSGSITNVNFNPTSKTTTTKRPITTTKRLTTTKTRRTSKPKKNNYERCTEGCKGRREPICAAPLSSTFLDPNKLKGFPTVCHMACHNSFRKDPYEKVVDGRCGRLRTRIRTVDSNTKLKRDELNKAQYFLDNSGTKTIVEVSSLN